MGTLYELKSGVAPSTKMVKLKMLEPPRGQGKYQDLFTSQLHTCYNRDGLHSPRKGTSRALAYEEDVCWELNPDLLWLVTPFCQSVGMKGAVNCDQTEIIRLGLLVAAFDLCSDVESPWMQLSAPSDVDAPMTLLALSPTRVNQFAPRVLNEAVSASVPAAISLAEAGKNQMAALISMVQEHDPCAQLYFRVGSADNSVKISNMLLHGILSAPRLEVGPNDSLTAVWDRLCVAHSAGADQEAACILLEKQHLDAPHANEPVLPPLPEHRPRDSKSPAHMPIAPEVLSELCDDPTTTDPARQQLARQFLQAGTDVSARLSAMPAVQVSDAEIPSTPPPLRRCAHDCKGSVYSPLVGGGQFVLCDM